MLCKVGLYTVPHGWNLIVRLGAQFGGVYTWTCMHTHIHKHKMHTHTCTHTRTHTQIYREMVYELDWGYKGLSPIVTLFRTVCFNSVSGTFISVPVWSFLTLCSNQTITICIQHPHLAHPSCAHKNVCWKIIFSHWPICFQQFSLNAWLLSLILLHISKLL